MSDSKRYGEWLHGVGCDVTNCRYNGCHQGAGCTCHAAHIDVRNENAMRKGETFCATFEPKAGI